MYDFLFNVAINPYKIIYFDCLACCGFLWTGVDVETRLGFEWTPLMCAVSVANYDLAKLLLDRGASANFSKG